MPQVHAMFKINSNTLYPSTRVIDNHRKKRTKKPIIKEMASINPNETAKNKVTAKKFRLFFSVDCILFILTPPYFTRLLNLKIVLHQSIE